MDCKALALQEKDYIIGLRRWFHAHPELGTEEIRTTERIAEELRAAGVEVETFPDITGCIGTLRGEKPGPTVMLRADIDALPFRRPPPASPTAPRIRASCTPAAMTATRPCSSARQSSSPPIRTRSPAP